MVPEPSTAVIQAVAAREGVDPINLTESLCDVIDPDSLDAICRTSTSCVTFAYHGYLVTVDGDSQVELTEPIRPPVALPREEPPSADVDVAKLRLQLRHGSLEGLLADGVVIWDIANNVVRKGPHFDSGRPLEN